VVTFVDSFGDETIGFSLSRIMKLVDETIIIEHRRNGTYMQL
jgi:hypothetical protein